MRVFDKEDGLGLLFLDSDDEWLPDKLLRQVEYIEKNPNAQFIHTNEIWIKNGQVQKQKKTAQKIRRENFYPLRPALLCQPLICFD